MYNAKASVSTRSWNVWSTVLYCWCISGCIVYVQGLQLYLLCLVSCWTVSSGGFGTFVVKTEIHDILMITLFVWRTLFSWSISISINFIFKGLMVLHIFGMLFMYKGNLLVWLNSLHLPHLLWGNGKQYSWNSSKYAKTFQSMLNSTS